MITIERLKHVINYHAETGAMTWRIRKGKQPAGKQVGTDKGNGYLQVEIDGKLYLVSRLAWFYVHHAWPTKHIDHIDRNTSNNRINNLREADDQQNGANRTRQKNNKIGIKGVYWSEIHQRWIAQCKGGRRRIVKYCKTPEAAKDAYAVMAKELHGEFSRTE